MPQLICTTLVYANRQRTLVPHGYVFPAPGGNPLVLGENDELPKPAPVNQPAGTLELAPGTCTFLVI